MTAFPWSTDGVAALTSRVLVELGADEVEIEASDIYVDQLIELADGGEVLPIDTSDPGGGFGGVDLWIATVIPALAAASGLRAAGLLTPGSLEQPVDEVLRRVKSPRAQRDRARLLTALCTALEMT